MFCDDDEDVMSRRCEDVVEKNTHKHVYTQTRLERSLFTHNHFYTKTLSKTPTFTRRPLPIQTLAHTQKVFYTQALSYQDYCRHSVVNAQALLHTEPFTQKRFDTKYYDLRLQDHQHTLALLHTNPFTQRHFYTQSLLHT